MVLNSPITQVLDTLITLDETIPADEKTRSRIEAFRTDTGRHAPDKGSGQ